MNVAELKKKAQLNAFNVSLWQQNKMHMKGKSETE